MMQSPNQGKMERNVSVPDEFAFETRMVVFNFMGLMPASCPPLATIDWPPSSLEHRRSINGRRTSSEQSDVALRAVSSQDDLIGGSEDQVTEPYTLIRKGTHLKLFTSFEMQSGMVSDVRSSSAAERASSCVVNGCQTSQSLDWDAPHVWITPASPPEGLDHPMIGNDTSRSLSMPGFLDTAGKCLIVHSLSIDASASEEVMLTGKSLNDTHSKRSSIVSCHLSPHPKEAYLSVERQRSWQSCQSGSTRSLASSLRRNSYVDVRQVDVTNLVHAQTLPPVAVQLKEEISKGIENLEKAFAQSRTERPIPPVLLQCPPLLPNATALVSPESQVADMLRVIGDRVEDDYSIVLNNATDELLRLQLLGRLTYDALQEAALHLLHHSSSGWTQVALVMLLSQRVSLTLLAQGDRSVGRLAEYTARFITDHIADFILSRGGWQSITEIGVVETPLPISDDPILSAVDTRASSDQLNSDVDPVKMENLNVGPSTAGSGEDPDGSVIHTTSPVNASQPGSSVTGVTSNNDVSSFTKAGGALETNTVNEEYRSELKAAGECHHSVTESSETPENSESRVPLLLGVCIFAIFGTWMVCKRIRKG